MPNDADNRRRAFAEVVAVDAWHDSFGSDTCRADLHADIVFGTARVGGETDSPIRFRLSIRRAELVIVIPETEPARVDKPSVSRDAPHFDGKLTQIVEGRRGASVEGSIGIKASIKGVEANAETEARAEIANEASTKLELAAEVQLMIVTQSQTADGHYRWAIESRTGGALEGRPWDANKAPRLTVIDTRKDRSKGIPPSVRVEVRCRREDLVIEDIEVKDEKLWKRVRSTLGFENRVAAAESFIRDRLQEEGLEVQNISDAFGALVLGSVTAESN